MRVFGRIIGRKSLQVSSQSLDSVVQLIVSPNFEDFQECSHSDTALPQIELSLPHSSLLLQRWSGPSSNWKSHQARMTRPRHPTNDDANQDTRLGASRRDLCKQVRWRDGVYCPRCLGESMIRYGSYRAFQRYRCKNCDRTFNDQTGTVVEHSAVSLQRWLLAIYTYIRSTSVFAS